MIFFIQVKKGGKDDLKLCGSDVMDCSEYDASSQDKKQKHHAEHIVMYSIVELIWFSN